MTRIKLILSRDRQTRCAKIARTERLCIRVKVNIIDARGCIVKIVLMKAWARIFHTSSAHGGSLFTMDRSSLMSTLTPCHNNRSLNMSSRLVRIWISLSTITIHSLTSRVWHVVSPWPRMILRQWLAMKTHSLPACWQVVTPIDWITQMIVLPNTTCINCAVCLWNHFLPPNRLKNNVLLTYWSKCSILDCVPLTSIVV